MTKYVSKTYMKDRENRNKFFKLFIFLLGLKLAIIGGIVYVAYHFISKYW